MSTIDALREGIRAMLKSHPALEKLNDGVRKADTVYVERYAKGRETGIGHEAGRRTQQNLWVALDAIRLSELEDIRHKIKPGYAEGERPGRNSNLEQIPGFRRAELVCFMPKTIEEVRRVIDTVAGRTR